MQMFMFFFVITAYAEKLEQEDFVVRISSFTTLLIILWHKEHYVVISGYSIAYGHSVGCFLYSKQG